MGWGIHPSCLNFVTLVFQPFSGPMVVSWISNYCTTHSQANEPSLSEKQNGECVHRSANVCTVLGGRSRGRLGGKGGGWASEKWGDLCILGWVHTTHCAPHFPPTHSAECIETSRPKYFLPFANLQLPSDPHLSSVINVGWSESWYQLDRSSSYCELILVCICHQSVR